MSLARTRQWASLRHQVHIKIDSVTEHVVRDIYVETAVDSFLSFLFNLGRDVHGTAGFHKHAVTLVKTDLAWKIN